MLADRLDDGTAVAAAATWDGDTGLAYLAHGRVCVADVVATTGDQAPLVDAIKAWAAKAPPGTTTVSVRATSLRFDACDPGASAKQTGAIAAAPDALSALAVRTQLAQGFVTDSYPATFGDCAANIILKVAGNNGVKKFTDATSQSDITQYLQSILPQVRPEVLAQCPAAQSG